MSLSFGTSVSVNNLLALKSFHTFLFNYTLHEKPSWIEKLWLPRLTQWVEKRAVAVMAELSSDVSAKTSYLTLNDVSGEFFAVLYIVQHQELTANLETGKELFMLLAQMALEFERIRKPRADAGYKQS